MAKRPKGKEGPGGVPEKMSSTATLTSGNIGTFNEKDELYNPFAHRDTKNTNSDLGSLAHLLKSSLGSGILAMPSAVKNGGLVFGGVFTIIIGILCSHCVHILVRSSHVLCRRTKTAKMTYAETAAAAFRTGPKPLRPFAGFAASFVNAALCATYIGGTCVYIVFVSTSVKQIVDYYTETDISVRLYMVMLIPAVITLGQIKNLNYLVPFSMVANISIIVGFAITMYYLFDGIQPVSSVNLFSSVSQLPKFFATVIFAIEGIGVVMPVENSMRKPQHFLGCPSVLNVAMTIVVVLYAIIGVFGYLKYGEDTLGSVTLNLNTEEILAQIVKLLIALAILFTYGLQYYVSIDIMWNAVKGCFSHNYQAVGEVTTRVLMVLLTVAIAIAVPDLEPFISLVGAVFFSVLGITIPAVIETISCWESHLGPCMWRLWKNSFLFIFSMLALIFGAWVSVIEIIELYQ